MPHYVHFREKKMKVILKKNHDLLQSKAHSCGYPGGSKSVSQAWKLGQQ